MSNYATYCRLGVHVYDSNVTVIRAAKRALWAPEFRKMRKTFYRQMISCHRRARGIVRAFKL